MGYLVHCHSRHGNWRQSFVTIRHAAIVITQRTPEYPRSSASSYFLSLRRTLAALAALFRIDEVEIDERLRHVGSCRDRGPELAAEQRLGVARVVVAEALLP